MPKQSAKPTFPLQHANQPDFPSRLQIERLRQELAHAQKKNQEYEDLIASLYNNICIKCRAHFEKHAPVGLATSSSAGAVTVSPSSKPKISPRTSNSPRLTAPSSRGRLFKGHHTAHSRTTGSVSSGIPRRPGVSKLNNTKASDFIEPNRSGSVSSESIQPSSLSVAQRPISLPETSTSPKDISKQLDWSVDFDSNVKPALNVKLERILIPGTSVLCVRFSPDGIYLAVAVGTFDHRRIYIYDVKTGAKSCSLADNSEKTKHNVWCLCFSPDGKYLAVGGSDEHIRIWEIAKKRIRNIFRLGSHLDSIVDLDFSPDGRFLVSCSYDGTVRIWRMRDGFSKLLEDTDPSAFFCVKFNPDGRYIAAGDFYGMLKIWNVRASRVGEWTAHGHLVHSVSFTPDGKGLVSSSADDTWKYWDISFLELAGPGYGMMNDGTAGQRTKVTAHALGTYSFAISRDARWVVSGSSSNGTVGIWDLGNAALQCTLKGHIGWVRSLDFCPTGNYLASCTEGCVALWRYEAT